MQHSAFRATELPGLRDDNGDRTLLRYEKPLEFTRSQWGIAGEFGLLCALDFRGDHVESSHTLAHGLVCAGKHFGQHPVSVGNCAVLAGQCRLPLPQAATEDPVPCDIMFNLLSQWSPNLHVAAQSADPHRCTRVGRFDNQVVADRHLDVSGVRKDQIAGPYLRTGHRELRR